MRLKYIKVGQLFHVNGFQTRYIRIATEGSDCTTVTCKPPAKFEQIPVVCLEDGPHKGDIRSFPTDHLVVPLN